MKSCVRAALFAFILTASAIAQLPTSPAKPVIPNCGNTLLNTNTNKWYCAACATGFVVTGLDQDVCSACAAGCDNGCTVSPTNCNKCKEAYFTTSPSFPAPCTNCVKGCRTCSTASTCTACYEGHFKTSNIGLDTCNSCIPGCRVCRAATGCDECFALHKKETVNGTEKCTLDGNSIILIVMIIMTVIICLICICWLSCIFCFAKAVSSTAPPQQNSSFTQ